MCRSRCRPLVAASPFCIATALWRKLSWRNASLTEEQLNSVASMLSNQPGAEWTPPPGGGERGFSPPFWECKQDLELLTPCSNLWQLATHEAAKAHWHNYVSFFRVKIVILPIFNPKWKSTWTKKSMNRPICFRIWTLLGCKTDVVSVTTSLVFSCTTPIRRV